MIRAVQKYFSEVPPVFLDGSIAVLIAVLATMAMYFSTDDAAKYVDPAIRFWLLLLVGSTLQGLHALSKFRDKTYTNHMEAKKELAEQTANNEPKG